MQNPKIQGLLNEVAELALEDDNKALAGIIYGVQGAIAEGNEMGLLKHLHEYTAIAMQQIRNIQAQSN